MNYLAHAYLSFGDPQIMVGNMISDFVKGSARLGYTASVQKGIMLHRMIDNYTDVHVATKRAKEIFRPDYRLYSGAIVDVLYDHFLANDPTIFNAGALQEFSAQVYQVLEEHADQLPARFSLMLPYMKQENWLLNYKEKWGIERSLRGLVRRAAYLSSHEAAYRLFDEEYVFLQSCYRDFFADVKEFAKKEFEQLL